MILRLPLRHCLEGEIVDCECDYAGMKAESGKVHRVPIARQLSGGTPASSTERFAR